MMRAAAVWTGLLLFYVAVRLPLLAVPLERDEGLFGVMGQAILRGDLPYRDVFEHKPPGVFYLYALGLLAVPPTAAGVHAFLAVWNLGTSLCVGRLAATLAGRWAAPWAVLVFVVASAAPSVQGFSATSEMLLLLPLSASVFAAVVSTSATRARRAILVGVSGALAAATFWIKQPAVLAAAAGPLAIILARRGALRALLWWASGAAAVTVVATVPFALAGVWREFWYWSFTHSWLYGQLPVGNWPERLAGNLVEVGRDLGCALVVALAGAIVGLQRARRQAWLVLGFLGLAVASALHSRFFYRHYFALLAPAVAVAAGTGIVWIEEAYGRRIAVAAAALTVALPVVARPWYWLRPDPTAVSVRMLGDQGFDAAAVVARYVRDRTAPDDRIFVYGSEPEIPFIAGRRDVNPFGMVYPLTWTWPRHREFQERVWASLERWPPVYLIAARNPRSFVRAPGIDPFFEERLTALGQRAYRLEAVLLADPGGSLRFADAPPETGDAHVVFEVWRRVPDAGA